MLVHGSLKRCVLSFRNRGRVGVLYTQPLYGVTYVPESALYRFGKNIRWLKRCTFLTYVTQSNFRDNHDLFSEFWRSYISPIWTIYLRFLQVNNRLLSFPATTNLRDFKCSLKRRKIDVAIVSYSKQATSI